MSTQVCIVLYMAIVAIYHLQRPRVAAYQKMATPVRIVPYKAIPVISSTLKRWASQNSSFPFLQALTNSVTSLQINPKSVDVNVHPTKREVHFLDEEEITQNVADAVAGVLAGQSQSREFQYQTTLTGGIVPSQAKTQSKGKGKEKAVEEDEEDQDAEGEVDEDVTMKEGLAPTYGLVDP